MRGMVERDTPPNAPGDSAVHFDDAAMVTTAGIHEFCVIARRAVDPCRMFDSRQAVDARTHGRRDSRQAVSPLVAASVDRAAMLGVFMKVLSVIILLELMLYPPTQANTFDRASHVCACSYSKIMGL